MEYTRTRELMQIRKFYDIDEVNNYLANESTDMQGCCGFWEFLGCGTETDLDGRLVPFYILGFTIYQKPEWASAHGIKLL